MSEPVNPAELEQPRERPFPWRCPKCRRQEVRRESVNHECRRIHEGRPVTVAVVGLQVPRCSACGEMVFDYLAEEQINAAYQEQHSAAFANGPSPVPGSEAASETTIAKKQSGETASVENSNVGA